MKTCCLIRLGLGLTAASAGAYVGARYATMKDMMVGDAPSGLMIRSSPSASAKALGSIPQGTIVRAGVSLGGWRRVHYQGVKGFSSSAFLFDVAPTTLDAPSSSPSPLPAPAPVVSPSSASPSSLVLLGNPLVLAPGKKYRARLALTGMAANPSLGTRERIASQFADLGFSNVQVFMDASELPPDWPAAYRSPASAGATRWAQGTSSGALSAPKPPEIDTAWEWTDAPATIGLELGPVAVRGLDPAKMKLRAPFDALMPGEWLPPNTRLKSKDRRAFLILQSDRNLVLYETATGRPLWSSGTQWDHDPKDPFRGALVMQTDGNLVLVDANGRGIGWDSKTNNYPLPKPGAYLVVQNDGNMVIYERPNRQGALWSTETDGFQRHHEDKEILHQGLSLAESAANGVVSAIHTVPGVNWIGEQIKDFAHTDLGSSLFRKASELGASVLMGVAAASGVAVVFMPVIGAAVYSASFVAPGLLRGDPIDQAWMQGFAETVHDASLEAVKVKLPSIPGMPDIDPVTEKLKDAYGKASGAMQAWADKAGIDLDFLANVPEDARAAVAKQLDVEAVARANALPPKIVQDVLNMATRTVGANGLAFTQKGTVKPKKTLGDLSKLAEIAARAAARPKPKPGASLSTLSNIAEHNAAPAQSALFATSSSAPAPAPAPVSSSLADKGFALLLQQQTGGRG